jgi:hypothetical protein
MPSVRSSWNNSARCSLKNESRSNAASPRSSRTSYSVNKIVCQIRQFVIDDVSDVLKLNPARSDVGCHKHSVSSLLESSEGGGLF